LSELTREGADPPTLTAVDLRLARLLLTAVGMWTEAPSDGDPSPPPLADPTAIDPARVRQSPSNANGNSKPSAAGGDLSTTNSGYGSVRDLVSHWGPRSYADVCAALPQGKLVRVGEQLVHVEQAGCGEPVVLLHGFGGSSHAWRLLMPTLAKRYRVIAPDLNGFGWTQRPREVGAYTYAGQAETVLGALRALGVERFHLVGHSYGGGLALWLAARHPARVRSLVLVSSVLPDYSQQQRQAWARFRGLNWLLVHFFVLSRAAVRRTLEYCIHDRELVTPELVDAYRERLLVEGVEDAYYGLMAPLDLPMPDVALDEVQAPTLVLWGREDKVIPLARAETYVPQIPGAELVVLDGCGHLAMEERPQQVLVRMLPFLERHRERWSERMRGGLRQFARRAAAFTAALP
jgi:pimeloyl-ACP methyl ester carboxylesterase